MTIQVVLSEEDESRLRILAEDRGVSPGALVSQVLKDIIERDRQVESLFAGFDASNAASGVSEAAFHRENWY
jgi:hypothetical protein